MKILQVCLSVSVCVCVWVPYSQYITVCVSVCVLRVSVHVSLLSVCLSVCCVYSYLHQMAVFYMCTYIEVDENDVHMLNFPHLLMIMTVITTLSNTIIS